MLLSGVRTMGLRLRTDIPDDALTVTSFFFRRAAPPKESQVLPTTPNPESCTYFRHDTSDYTVHSNFCTLYPDPSPLLLEPLPALFSPEASRVRT